MSLPGPEKFSAVEVFPLNLMGFGYEIEFCSIREVYPLAHLPPEIVVCQYLADLDRMSLGLTCANDLHSHVGLGSCVSWSREPKRMDERESITLSLPASVLCNLQPYSSQTGILKSPENGRTRIRYKEHFYLKVRKLVGKRRQVAESSRQMSAVP